MKKEENKLSKMIITKINDSSACLECLEWYKSVAVIVGGEMKVKMSSVHDMFKSMVVEELLLNSISSTPELPEQSKRKAIWNAVRRWLSYEKYKRNSHILLAFKEAFSIEVSRLLAQKRDYRMLAFINMDASSIPDNKSYTLWGNEIQTISWSDVDEFELKGAYGFITVQAKFRGLSKYTYQEQDDSICLRPSLFTPFLVNINSFSPRDALREGIEIVDMFRACINFASATRTLIKYSNQEPICTFLPSPFYTIYSADNTRLLDTLYSSDQYTYLKKESLPSNEIITADHLLSILNDINDGLSNLFRRTLYLYQQALDKIDHRASYLALWQVAEACILDKPSQHIKVDRKLALLTGLETIPIFDKGISLVNEKRNKLVHSGKFPEETDNIRFVLKKFVDTAIYKLLFLAKHLEDEEELEEYIAHLPVNNAKLGREKKAIEMILSSR